MTQGADVFASSERRQDRYRFVACGAPGMARRRRAAEHLTRGNSNALTNAGRLRKVYQKISTLFSNSCMSRNGQTQSERCNLASRSSSNHLAGAPGPRTNFQGGVASTRKPVTKPRLIVPIVINGITATPQSLVRALLRAGNDRPGVPDQEDGDQDST